MYSCILPTSYYVIITMLVFKKALSYFNDSTAHSREEATALPEPMFIKPFQLNLITQCNSQVSLVIWRLSLESSCVC